MNKMETADQIQKKKILVIEDDSFMIDLLSTELEKTGINFVIAKTGTEGIEKFKEIKPDLILLDIILPDQNGFDALRAIRRMEGGAEAKVIILSNVAEGPNIEEAKRLGVNEYLIKSNFSLAEIFERIKNILVGVNGTQKPRA